MAGAAAALGGDFTPALDQCRIDRLAAPLRRELVEMLRQGLRVGVRQILDERGLTSMRRTPSRIRINWSCRKNSGWPASDGMFFVRELPSSPWQALHPVMRSASDMSCASAHVAKNATAATASYSITPVSLLSLWRPGGLLTVGDAISRTVVLVRYKERAVRHLEDVGRPAVELILRLVEEPGHERLDLGGAIRLGAGDDDVVTELLLSIPRPTSGDEGDILVVHRKHAAGDYKNLMPRKPSRPVVEESKKKFGYDVVVARPPRRMAPPRSSRS